MRPIKLCSKRKIWHIIVLLCTMTMTGQSFFIVKPKNNSAINEMVNVFEKRIEQPRKHILREMRISRIQELEKERKSTPGTTVPTTTTELPMHFLDEDYIFEEELHDFQDRKSSTTTYPLSGKPSSQYEYEYDTEQMEMSVSNVSFIKHYPSSNASGPVNIYENEINRKASGNEINQKASENKTRGTLHSAYDSNIYCTDDVKQRTTLVSHRSPTKMVTRASEEEEDEEEDEIDELGCFTAFTCPPSKIRPTCTTTCRCSTTKKKPPNESCDTTTPNVCGRITRRSTTCNGHSTPCCTDTITKKKKKIHDSCIKTQTFSDESDDMIPTCIDHSEFIRTTPTCTPNNAICTTRNSCTTVTFCKQSETVNPYNNYEITQQTARANVSIYISINRLEPFLKIKNASGISCNAIARNKLHSVGMKNKRLFSKSNFGKIKKPVPKNESIKNKPVAKTTQTTRTRKSLKSNAWYNDHPFILSDYEDNGVEEIDTPRTDKLKSNSTVTSKPKSINSRKLELLFQSLFSQSNEGNNFPRAKIDSNISDQNRKHRKQIYSLSRSNWKNKVAKTFSKDMFTNRNKNKVPPNILLDLWKDDILRPLNYPRNLESVGRRIYDAGLAIRMDLDLSRENQKKLKEEERLIRKGIRNLHGIMSECSCLEDGLKATKSNSIRKLKELLEVAKVRNKVENKINVKIKDILQLNSDTDLNKVLKSV